MVGRARLPEARAQQHMAEPRPPPMRLKEWLVAQVDSGRYPGLCWENGEKTLFRIPWKHAAKQDYRQQEDAALFKVSAPSRGSPQQGCLPKHHFIPFPNSCGTLDGSCLLRSLCALAVTPSSLRIPPRSNLPDALLASGLCALRCWGVSWDSAPGARP